MSTTWIGEQIKKAREKRGLTQQELAMLVNVAPITIHQYEHGKRNPNFDILTKISEVLNTPFFISRDIRRNVNASIERAIEFDGHEKTAQYIQEKCGIELSSENPLDENKFTIENLLLMNEIRFMTFEDHTGKHGKLFAIDDDKFRYFLTTEQCEKLPSMAIEQIKTLIKAMAEETLEDINTDSKE